VSPVGEGSNISTATGRFDGFDVIDDADGSGEYAAQVGTVTGYWHCGHFVLAPAFSSGAFNIFWHEGQANDIDIYKTIPGKKKWRVESSAAQRIRSVEATTSRIVGRGETHVKKNT
jgi:hypothetical protein